jgi:hypothetical protein
MRRHEEVEFAVEELKRHNIRHDVRDTDGGHVEIAWQVSTDKEVRRVFTSKTPSDHRSRLNARSVIRQFLRQDGVDLAPKPPVVKQKPKLLEKALQAPRHEPTIPEQLSAMRAEMADLTDLLLDISSAIAIIRDRGSMHAAPPPTHVAAAPQIPLKQQSVRSKKAITYISKAWNSLDAIAKELGLPRDITYRKLYYLKQQDIIEFDGGRCRLKPEPITQ